MQIPFYKKVLSYIYPITLEKTIGNNFTILMVQLYCNEFLLVTPKAIYSFGTRYDPFRKMFKLMQHQLPHVESFLLLGTGLGSALAILQKKYACYPNAVLIDNDEDVLAFSMRYFSLNAKKNVTWKCMDATHFLHASTQKFDLIGVDIFKDLIAPNYVTSTVFIEQCKQSLHKNGSVLFNLILNDEESVWKTNKKLQTHFEQVQCIRDKINTYFICTTN